MSQATAWLLLVTSGIVDVAWAYATKRADGFSQPHWGVASLVLLAIFIALLMRALAVLPLGPAYAVWTGIGAVGSFAVGVFLLSEPATAARLVCVALILGGVVGLRLAG